VPFEYRPPLDGWVQTLKFKQRLSHARVLGELAADYLEDRLDACPDRIIPVPLHRARLRQRGYNQALEIARPIARRLKTAIDYRSVYRSRATPPQSRLSHRVRRANIRGAFTACADVTGIRVAIVDDVMTTGSTVGELARCLRRAGAEDVEVWVVARA